MSKELATWTCNPETGAIFDEHGTVIGVADKSSAISITERHNRAVREGLIRNAGKPSEFDPWGWRNNGR